MQCIQQDILRLSDTGVKVHTPWLMAQSIWLKTPYYMLLGGTMAIFPLTVS